MRPLAEKLTATASLRSPSTANRLITTSSSDTSSRRNVMPIRRKPIRLLNGTAVDMTDLRTLSAWLLGLVDEQPGVPQQGVPVQHDQGVGGHAAQVVPPHARDRLGRLAHPV